jgi:hypothetical protein
MLYHQTKDILFVMQFLGHRKIENTLFYIQLEQALFQNVTEEYICKVAKNLKEATELIEAGFQYVTEMDGCKLFRKPKTSFLGSSSREMGSSASLADLASGDISRDSPSFFVVLCFVKTA